MKREDLQKLVLSKYEAEQTPKKIFQDLNSAVSYPTVKRCFKMIRETGAIDLSKLFGCHRTIRTKGTHTKNQKKIKGQ